MITKNLGGDRIGSGAKINVDLDGFGRSTHSLTTDIATTMSIGTLLPIHHSLILAGDTRELDIDAMIITKPTNGPLFNSAKLQIDVFKFDIRLYNGKLHMNLLDKGLAMSAIKFPQIEMRAAKIDWTKDPNNQQINPSSIFKYLHISGVGDTNDSSTPLRYFNAVPWLGYWDIYKNYYANKQERFGAVIHTGNSLNETITAITLYNIDGSAEIEEIPASGSHNVSTALESYIIIEYTGAIPNPATVIFNTSAGEKSATEIFSDIITGEGAIRMETPTGTYVITNWRYAGSTDPISSTPRVRLFELNQLDEIKMDILQDVKSTSPFLITNTSPEPFNLALDANGSIYNKMYSQEGLALKTYQSDKFNNWLNTESIDDIDERSAVQIDGDGKFTINSLLLKYKLFDHLNRIAVAGGTVDDMMEVTYDVRSISRSEIPTFEGGLSKELVFQQVISNSASESQPLGTIAGRGTLQGHKGGKIRIHNNDTQHAYYMVIASLTPRLMYTQGNGWGTNLKNYDELHKPIFDQIGFQDLPTDEMASWDTKTTNTGIVTLKSAGKQTAWLSYQTEIDRAFGNFAIQNSEGWMIFDRNYDWDEVEKTIKDLTTYIDPAKYNGVFSYKAIDAQNIWLQVKIKDVARRKMSASQMPRM